MNNFFKTLSIVLLCLICMVKNATANYYTATPLNYKSFLAMLTAGDTLCLSSGNYTDNMVLNNLNRTADNPIVITGSSNLYTTVFQATNGSNTISITKCSYLVIKNLRLDGRNMPVDAVKAEGTTGNWAHHITIEYLYITGYGNNQQIVGTLGYNIEIKHQADTVRHHFPGTAVNGKTVIRHNVFSKETNAATGSDARPNLLVGSFPVTGPGKEDYYEIYGNFFWQNPTEALFQGTGNIMLYNNIFVNNTDAAGYRAVYITEHNNVKPRYIRIFHNTVWAVNSSGGIRLYNPDPAFRQYCYANAVFSPSPVTNFTGQSDNITDSYVYAVNYVISATPGISTIDLYPKNGMLTGTETPDSLFNDLEYYDRDFNCKTYNWTYRGAYSGYGINPGWHLQLDTMPDPGHTTTSLNDRFNRENYRIFPEPNSGTIRMEGLDFPARLIIYNLRGEIVRYCEIRENENSVVMTGLHDGIYIFKIITTGKIIMKKLAWLQEN